LEREQRQGNEHAIFDGIDRLARDADAFGLARAATASIRPKAARTAFLTEIMDHPAATF
jgi:hypothetical protein